MSRAIDLGTCPICHGRLFLETCYSFSNYYGMIGCNKCGYSLGGPICSSSEKARQAVYEKWSLLTGKAERDYRETKASVKKRAVKAASRRRAKEIMSNPDDARHGRHTTYDLGCRCEKCRQAESEYRQDLKRRKSEKVLP